MPLPTLDGSPPLGQPRFHQGAERWRKLSKATQQEGQSQESGPATPALSWAVPDSAAHTPCSHASLAPSPPPRQPHSLSNQHGGLRRPKASETWGRRCRADPIRLESGWWLVLGPRWCLGRHVSSWSCAGCLGVPSL